MLAGNNQYSSPMEIFPQGETGKARDQAAAATNTNPRYVQDAKKLHDEAPDLFQQVREGGLTIPQAKREYVKRTRVEPPPMEGKYRVIYADPPWSYGNSMPEYFTEQADHYPLMSIDDICELPVKDLAENNAVLFLWATSPILEKAFSVISSWGFKYKSSFVWDKIKHNMGHYNSVRHEFLLICVRGSCQPDVQKLFDSVQSIERTEHSRKPKEFRNIIDTIYPNGKRIELFARETAENWEAWGNERLS
jgi:N6-adenosine-specific RNA methylase IME4